MATRRRKGKWTSPGSAAARLAWWRWHHNPKTGRKTRRRCNPKPARKVSYFHGIGYSGANITHQGRRYVYVTTVLAKPEITRLVGTPLQRLGHAGSTKHGDLVWSYAGRLSKARRNPVQHLDHAAYAAKVRRMTDAALRYTMKDASEAIRAMPYGEKAGYYADEIHACSGELRRRQKGGRQETNPRKRRRCNPRSSKITKAEVRQWWSTHGEAAARDIARAGSSSEMGAYREAYNMSTAHHDDSKTGRFNAQVKDAIWNELQHKVFGSTITKRYPWK